MAVQIVEAPAVHHVAHVLPGGHIGLAARLGRFGHPVIDGLFRVGRDAQQHFGRLLRVGDGAFGGHEAGEALGQDQHEVDGRREDHHHACGIGELGVGREANGGVEGNGRLQRGHGNVDEYLWRFGSHFFFGLGVGGGFFFPSHIPISRGFGLLSGVWLGEVCEENTWIGILNWEKGFH